MHIRSPAAAFLLALMACQPAPHAGNRPSVCARHEWPLIPNDLNLPETNLLLIPSRGDTAVVYYRDLALVAFDDTVGGAAIRAFFTKYGGEIIGGADYVGSCGGYVLRIPDPGRSWAAIDSVLSRMEREAGVNEVSDITYRDRVEFRGGKRSRPRRP